MAAVSRTTKSGITIRGVLFCVLSLFFVMLSETVHGFWPFQPDDSSATSGKASEIPKESSAADDLQRRVAVLAESLHENLLHGDFQRANLSRGLIVCTFVDLKKLYRTSSFGRYLAEQFMNAFQQQGYRVVELRKARQVMVLERYGEYGLSRESGEIEQDVTAGAMLTGTYLPAGREIVVSAKIIDLRDGSLLSTAGATFPHDHLLATLLRDSSTAPTGEEYVTYMKKLER